jgi:hypothetical protein
MDIFVARLSHNNGIQPGFGAHRRVPVLLKHATQSKLEMFNVKQQPQDAIIEIAMCLEQLVHAQSTSPGAVDPET